MNRSPISDELALSSSTILLCDPCFSSEATFALEGDTTLVPNDDLASWLAALPGDGHPVVLVDERIGQDSWRQIHSQLQQDQPIAHLFLELWKQRSYLTAFLTWLHACLFRCLFGLRKTPEQPAVVWFPDARPLRLVLETLVQQANDAPTISQVRRYLPGFLSEATQIGTPWQLDRVLAALKVQQWDYRQTEILAAAPLPRRSNWKARCRMVLARGYSMASTCRDWWNWKLMPTHNAWALSTDKTPTPKTTNWKLQAWALASLLLLGFVVLGIRADYPLFEPDEARNAQLAINILESGDWVSLHLGSEPYWDKPPAVAWGTAVAYQLFGVHAWSTRLVSMLSALLTVGLVFVFGQRWIGFRSAWLAGCLLLLSTGFVVCGRYATMDAAITACALTMLGCLYLACYQGRLQWGYWVVACLACGVGLLIKGPVIGVLTLPPLLAWLWLSRNPVLWDWKPWAALAAGCLLVAGPWFVTMGYTEPEFLVYFFWKHHVVRFSDAFNHREPFWFYLPVFLLGTFPASLLLPTCLPWLRKFGPACRQASTPATGLLLLYVLWIVGFFSLSDSKLPTYILPAFPAVALLFGNAVVAFVTDWQQMPRVENRFVNYFVSIPRRSAVSVASAVVIFSLVSVLLFKQNAWTGWFAGLAVSGLIISLFAWIWNRHLRYATGLSLGLGLIFVITISGFVLPSVSAYRSIQKATAELRQQPELRDLPIVFYEHEDYGCQLWLPTEQVRGFDQYNFTAMLEHLKQHPQALIVSRLDSMEVLRSNLSDDSQLSSIRGSRHVYLYQHAEDSAPLPELPRIADRLMPVTFSR